MPTSRRHAASAMRVLTFAWNWACRLVKPAGMADGEARARGGAANLRRSVRVALSHFDLPDLSRLLAGQRWRPGHLKTPVPNRLPPPSPPTRTEFAVGTCRAGTHSCEHDVRVGLVAVSIKCLKNYCHSNLDGETTRASS
ncbi:MAG: hypothetical protein FE78DRAFT_42486 [Acidomyces sp. 'richmondensis']|nr:MAG: hypothetical protein FE78DRAFT_42486 [Acidomyces sp. 'richmondensis']